MEREEREVCGVMEEAFFFFCLDLALFFPLVIYFQLPLRQQLVERIFKGGKEKEKR